MTRVLVIDNYDSFTYNLVQVLQVAGAEVIVQRNDRVAPSYMDQIAATHLVVSPGPGRPEEAGRSIEFIRAAYPKIPVLGVCLGHQAIAASRGLTVDVAATLMHGKTSLIHHNGDGLFEGLSNPFEAGRYHSLAVTDRRVRDDFEVTAWTDDGEVMAIRDPLRPVVGVQFHPESVLTPEGPRLLSNFLQLTIPSESHTIQSQAPSRIAGGGDS